MSNRSASFGQMLKGVISSIATYEGKTVPMVEDELGSVIGLTGASIQRYKAGHIPPEPRTIQILAEAAVKRGYVNCQWAQEFLKVAHYPNPPKVINQLYPQSQLYSRPTQIYQNLPAPPYSQFVMREQAYADVVDGLQQRAAVVLIVSLGGMGKTSLAHEIATNSLKGINLTIQFDAVVWVSDKDRPGTTTLSILLDKIAHTLDYPGFTQFEYEEKLREVEQLLRRQRVLLVVDNFETIKDEALLNWLLRLPEPSKALVTSREYSRAFRNNTFVVDLRGMDEKEAQNLISYRLRFLRIQQLAGDQTDLTALVTATGGNPKAIELALGCLKHGKQTLQEVIADLYSAQGVDDLFEYLFARCWDRLLNKEAQQLLMALPLFPTTVSRSALGATAAMHSFVFDHTIERLIDLALVDVRPTGLNSAPRYALHPLVRAFAKAKLHEWPDFEKAARERWLEWYVQLVQKVGFAWDDLSKLELLDLEYETIHFAVEWAFQHQRYDETLQLTIGIQYYYTVRGLWDKKLQNNLMRAESARHLGKPVEEIEALADHVQTLSKQDNVAEAESYLVRLRELAKTTDLPGDSFFVFQHAIALYQMACGDLDAAQQAWSTALSRSDQMSPQIQISNHHWLATCEYRQGLLAKAKEDITKVLDDATRAGYQRSVMFSQLSLANIDLDHEDLDSAEQRLEESSKQAIQFCDRACTALIQVSFARLHLLRYEPSAAHSALTKAIDLFERLGMRRELADARAMLV